MEGDVPFADVYDLMVEQAKNKANFCISLNIAPSEYDQLTQIEINAFVEEHNRQQKEANKK